MVGHVGNPKVDHLLPKVEQKRTTFNRESKFFRPLLPMLLETGKVSVPRPGQDFRNPEQKLSHRPLSHSYSYSNGTFNARSVMTCYIALHNFVCYPTKPT